MAGRFTFVDETDGLHSAVLVQGERTIWEHDATEDHSGEFADSADVTLTDINDTYMTADDDNETRYFSTLETSNEVSLNETLEHNPKLSLDTETQEVNEEVAEGTVDIAGQQVSLFKVGDTDILYGIQLAQDEDGQIRKYQFQIRNNEDGALEAIPETIQVLPFECEVPLIESSEIPEDTNSCIPEHVYIKQELHNEALSTAISDDKALEEENFEQDGQISHFTEENNIEGYHVTSLQDFNENQSGFEYTASLEDSTEDGRGHVHKVTISEKGFFKNNINQATNEDHFGYLLKVNESKKGNVESNDEEDEYHDQLALKSNEVDEEDNIESQEESHMVSTGFKQIFVKEEIAYPVSDDNMEAETIDAGVDLNHIFSSSSETLQENHQNNFVHEHVNENESDNEDYQIVEGFHVTGDVDVNDTLSTFDGTSQHITFSQSEKTLPLQTHVLKLQGQTFPQRKITKNIIRNVKIKKVISTTDKSKDNMYFVIKHPEKENVEEISTLNSNNIIKSANPRSLLKISQPTCIASKEVQPEDRFEKRFAKSKEAIQARQFHNFIAQTKIIHAPVRQERLPRKQKIKPVSRTDEEIIVQEVVVSSKGYIETKEDGVVKDRQLLKPTEFIQLSDSDDDYDPKTVGLKRKRKSKKRKSIIEITISDSDGEKSDYDAIAVDSDESGNGSPDQESEVGLKKRKAKKPKSLEDFETNEKLMDVSEEEESQVPENVGGIVRKRGRPPKVHKNKIGGNTAEKGKKVEKVLSSKMQQPGENEEVSYNKSSVYCGDKTEIQCSKCTKTFPSQGSLKTHMQFHTFKEANLKNMKKLQTDLKNLPSKYKCSECNDAFKNNILLMRHKAVHEKSKVFLCTICKKKFSTNSLLIAHKRAHIKEQMYKSTVPPSMSPASLKFRPPSVNTKPKTPKKFSCVVCRKVFSTQILLDAHMKMHKQFTCATCGLSFTSKFMLDNHLRDNCIKMPKTKRESLGRASRKSFLPRFSYSRASMHPPKVVRETILLRVDCDQCDLTFNSHTSLFKHKVVIHGLPTPDKSVAEPVKKSAVKKQEHGGVYAAGRLQQAFSSFKQLLDD